jgi:hypothetical protein
MMEHQWVVCNLCGSADLCTTDVLETRAIVAPSESLRNILFLLG